MHLEQSQGRDTSNIAVEELRSSELPKELARLRNLSATGEVHEGDVAFITNESRIKEIEERLRRNREERNRAV